MEQDTPSFRTLWYEWALWKHAQLVDAGKAVRAQEFMRELLAVMRCPIAGWEVAMKKTEGARLLQGGKLGAWLAANPDPLGETHRKMQAMRERWGDVGSKPAAPSAPGEG